MKKLLSVLLVMCCVFCLFGCDTVDKVGELELPPVPTADATETVPKSENQLQSGTGETEHQHIIINIERTVLEALDPQQAQELILSFSYETPYVHIPYNPNAELAINEFVALLNESYYTGDDYGVAYSSGHEPGYINMLTMAEDNYNYMVNSAINFSEEAVSFELASHRTVNVERCDERVLSLRFYDYVNMGGVHGSYAYRAYCFDTKNGELISLDSLSTEPDGLKAYIADYVVDTIKSDAQLQARVAGFVDSEGMPTLEEAARALVREGSWYLGDNGLVIFSDLYEMGPYAAGILEFELSYESLGEYIKPEYLPEANEKTAVFSVVPAEKLSESSREIIDMVKLHEEGQAIYFVADGYARNIRLTAVDYTDAFYETDCLWYCSEMNDCAVQVVTNIPEGMPDLKLSYTDSLGEHEFYLSQSGVDGSFILVDGSIEAVG